MIFNVINITVIIAIVRPGCDIVGVVVAGADHPSKAKVAELHHTVLCYQDVLWLHIPDDDDDDVDDDDDYDYGKDNNDDDIYIMMKCLSRFCLFHFFPFLDTFRAKI